MAPNPTLVPASLMSQYLAKEKIATRHWLQCQMESLLDQVFDQLSTKFEDYLASNAITGTEHHYTFDPDAIQHEHINEPPFGVHSRHQFKATTDQLINSKVRFNVGQSRNRGQMMNFDEQVMNSEGIDFEIFDLEQYPHSLSVPSSNLEQSNQNDDEYENDRNEPPNDDDSVILVDSDDEEVKINDSNKQIITTVYPHSYPNCSNLEQSNQNDDDDEYGINRYDDNQQQNDHMKNGNADNKRHDKERFRPRKKPKLETNQPNNNLQSRFNKHSMSHEPNRKQTDQVQLIKKQSDEKESNEQTEPNEEADEPNEVNNNNEKQIITIRVQCHETDCPQMFNNKTELNDHMITQHDIMPFRCLVKDCKQSFTNQISMSEHMNQDHSDSTQYHCDKCTKHFPAYPILYRHNYHNHQLGQYKCSFSNCTFTGGHRRKVFDHYKNQHKPTVELICEHCGRRFSDKSNFKRHQEAHLGIKPYRCKWPSCGYASTHGPSTIIHIRRMHLNQGSTETSQIDPREYLEVVR